MRIVSVLLSLLLLAGCGKSDPTEKHQKSRDRIIVSYSGRANDSAESAPTTLLLFDLEGNYLESWETGHRISDFCLDAENRRLILALDDAVQFAALDLRGLVDPA